MGTPAKFTYKGHSAKVISVDMAPDGSTVASLPTSSDPSGLRIWRAQDGTELFQSGKGIGSYHGLRFSPDGRLLVCAGWQSSLELYSTATLATVTA